MIDRCEVPMVTSDGPWGDALTAEKWKVFLQTKFGSKGKAVYA